jgi:hypothetical protein
MLKNLQEGRSQDNSVNKVNGYKLDSQGSILSRGKSYLFATIPRLALRPNQWMVGLF